MCERLVDGTRRPLIIVYDEGHNLSNQQTEILLELEPDAILTASATTRVPEALGRIIAKFRNYGWTDDDLVTGVVSKDVVKKGLVKAQVILGGYVSNMEGLLDDMLDAMETTTARAIEHAADFTPKAIYVCRTNISQDDGTKDNANRPFRERQAPPILIWRYLVEKKGIDPKSIAVYCDLTIDRKVSPPPPDFILFSGGEDDYDVFAQGDYRHIIFNQSLQEGWDDPECCFAYIDKSMGSPVQIEQVIGRVLRQPNAQHYGHPDLNTADFYIRMDGKQQFPGILESVERKLGATAPHVRIESYTDRRQREQMKKEPKQALSVPHIFIDSEQALSYETGSPTGPLADVIDAIHDYSEDRKHTVGKGHLLRAVQKVGRGLDAKVQTIELQHSNRVMARWIVKREVASHYRRAERCVDWSLPKFDARVEVTSPAADALRREAERIVDAYLEHSVLAVEDNEPYVIPPISVRPAEVVTFKHSLHEGYSGLNETLELPFAHALDAVGLPWARNPSNGGFSIPLLEKGDSENFFPDFLAWKDDVIYALDPKGEHRIGTDAATKLLALPEDRGARKVRVRLITKGKWQSPTKQTTTGGYSVWTIRVGKPHARHFDDLEQAVAAALK